MWSLCGAADANYKAANANTSTTINYGSAAAHDMNAARNPTIGSMHWKVHSCATAHNHLITKPPNTDKALDWWAARLRLWINGKQPPDAKLVLRGTKTSGVRNAFIYFDNDAKVKAPRDAQHLAQRLAV